MPENTMRIDRHTPETRLDRLVTQKASEALNAMPRRFRPTRSSGVQIRAFRRTEGVPRRNLDMLRFGGTLGEANWSSCYGRT